MIDKYVTIERLGFVRELLRISGFNSKIKANHVKTIDDAITMLKKQEAVVRCKDCKYAYLTDDGECKYCEMEKDDNGFLIERYRSWDWFCADGERKEGR